MSFLVPIEHLPDHCPDCNAEIRSVHKGSQHTNGHWNERVVYRCDTNLVFTPNYYPGPHAISKSESCAVKRTWCTQKCGAYAVVGKRFCSDRCGRAWAESQ